MKLLHENHEKKEHQISKNIQLAPAIHWAKEKDRHPWWWRWTVPEISAGKSGISLPEPWIYLLSGIDQQQMSKRKQKIKRAGHLSNWKSGRFPLPSTEPIVNGQYTVYTINETYETMLQPSQALDSAVSIWCPNMVFQWSPCFANLASTSQWLPCWLLVPMGERLATQRCNLDDRRNNGICPSKKKAGKL